MEFTIIITMAGEGTRFRKAGYNVPKHEIDVKGQSLFFWALKSLERFNTSTATWVFVARKEHHPRIFIARECKKLGIFDWDLIELEHLTNGQATTVLYAKPCLSNKDQAICVYNIDTFVHPSAIGPEHVRGDGWIPCFPGEGDHWSFVKLSKEGRATEVREKQRISNYCTVGFYWFKSFTLYEHLYHAYYCELKNIEKSERYIAPMYNQLISEDGNVYIHEIEPQHVIPLGTPQEVENFINNMRC